MEGEVWGELLFKRYQELLKLGFLTLAEGYYQNYKKRNSSFKKLAEQTRKTTT